MERHIGVGEEDGKAIVNAIAHAASAGIGTEGELYATVDGAEVDITIGHSIHYFVDMGAAGAARVG